MHMSTDAPHLLKLYSDLIECLSDDCNKDVFDEPGQKEYHGAEVEHGPPAW